MDVRRGTRLEALKGYAFIAPWLIGFTAFTYYPVANLCVDRTMGIRRLRALVRSPLPATMMTMVWPSFSGGIHPFV